MCRAASRSPSIEQEMSSTKIELFCMRKKENKRTIIRREYSVRNK